MKLLNTAEKAINCFKKVGEHGVSKNENLVWIRWLLHHSLGNSNGTRIVGAYDYSKDKNEIFKGIPVSLLNEIAQKINKGKGCYIDSSGFLVFTYDSNRGHMNLSSQIMVDKSGKLVRLGGNYPGQINSPADKFVKEVNDTFGL